MEAGGYRRPSLQEDGPVTRVFLEFADRYALCWKASDIVRHLISYSSRATTDMQTVNLQCYVRDCKSYVLYRLHCRVFVHLHVL